MNRHQHMKNHSVLPIVTVLAHQLGQQQLFLGSVSIGGSVCGGPGASVVVGAAITVGVVVGSICRWSAWCRHDR